MNVIIAYDKTIRFTQQSNDAYNIQDISFYISKSLSFTDAYIKLVKNRSEYPFWLMENGTAVNYEVYRVIFTEPVSLSEREYDLVLCLDETELNLGTFTIEAIDVKEGLSRAKFALTRTATGSSKPYYGLTDQDEPVDIIGRTISFSNKQNELVAEDNISQLITFRMPKTYEGIEMFEKVFYLDYLPPSKTEPFNIEIINKKIIDDYLYLYWPVPYEVTKYGINLPIAISAIDLGMTSDSADENGAVNSKAQQYIWQTYPATLQIKKNLAKRNSAPISEGDDPSSLINLLTELEKRQDELEASDIYNLDSVNPFDGEIVLTGGGAEIE